MNGIEEHVRLLLTKSADDLIVVKKLLDDPEVSDSTIGFHIQQSIEKALKATLVHNQINFRRTHDIRELLDFVKLHVGVE